MTTKYLRATLINEHYYDIADYVELEISSDLSEDLAVEQFGSELKKQLLKGKPKATQQLKIEYEITDTPFKVYGIRAIVGNTKHGYAKIVEVAEASLKNHDGDKKKAKQYLQRYIRNNDLNVPENFIEFSLLV